MSANNEPRNSLFLLSHAAQPAAKHSRDPLSAVPHHTAHEHHGIHALNCMAHMAAHAHGLCMEHSRGSRRCANKSL